MNSSVKTYLQPAFMICVIILFISAAGMSFAVKKFGMYLQKEPLPLKKSLELLDQKGLGHYKIIARDKIENKDILKSLGTEDYIQWVLEDPDVPADSPVRQCMLFITYYGMPDRVPHVPEECYTGGGFQKLSSETLPLKLQTAETQNSNGILNNHEILVKYLVFGAPSSEQWLNSSNFSVLYVFNVDGQYTNSREETRIVLNKNIFNKHSYFSKVEWKFFNTSFGQQVPPSKEQAAMASVKLLKVILPILEKEHWPQILKNN
jgi:hypothetical protein